MLRVVAPNPGPMTLGGTNTYVVGAAPCWVIDPGPDDPAHVDAVRDAAESRGGLAGVLLTHSHADHSAAVERLGAPLAWGEVSDRDEGTPPTAEGAVLPHPPERWAGQDGPDGVGGGAGEVGPFRVIATPGHAPDHACFAWGEVVFCGDLVLGSGSSIVPPAAMGGSLADYMASLERVRALAPALMCPGHGPWITDPEERLSEYAEHRRDRERRLLAALDAGERDRDRLLEAGWADVPEPLRPAAALAMQAHLEKLASEGSLPPELDA